MNKGDAKKAGGAAKKSKKRGISEEKRIFIHQELSRFQLSTEPVMQMPINFSKAERAYAHQAVRLFAGLKSKSSGKGSSRQLTISKKTQSTEIRPRIEAMLPDELTGAVVELLREALPSSNGRTTHGPSSSAAPSTGPPEAEQTNRTRDFDGNGRTLGVRNLNRRLIPAKSYNSSASVRAEREALPIFTYRNEIQAAIEQEQVIIIQGDTGSGKTTQVPQYILEYAERSHRPCRIVCTQPRRLAAISIAERVASERGESVGRSVGYQIRLESRFHAGTNLIYATTGCMIRAIISDAADTFQGVTHIIIDEIHERDKNTDFMLISLRDELKTNRQLKVILMSATMDIEQLSNYFHRCHIVNVPGRCYEIRTFFLDDILYYTNYQTERMRKILNQMSAECEKAAQGMQIVSTKKKKKRNKLNESDDLKDDETGSFIDDLLEICCNPGQCHDDVRSSFDQLLYLIEGEGISADVQHSRTGITILMAAAIQSNVTYLNRLLAMKADRTIRDYAGRSAADYAEQHDDGLCTNCLSLSAAGPAEIDQTDEKEKRLDAYQLQQSDDDEIDHALLLELLATINRADNRGSILVFLPGYNDMIVQKELINENFDSSTYVLFLIHGSMSTHHQREVFATFDVRKFILATNIAETSITFPDVAYVIDTGKVKQFVYDSLTGSSYLKSVDISQACAMQRAGRAGRTQTGICYRLYSARKFQAMSEYAIPEILRIPLTEICLYAKAIDGRIGIAEYLAKALVPPSPVSINSAIDKLIVIGALDRTEQITQLGRKLVHIPLDVQLGKILLFGILLRCLDPILSIVAYYSVKDPFLLPADRSERGRVSRMRKELCENYFSDHLGIIRLFQKWQKSRQLGTESHFLIDHNLSKASLEMMAGVRQQVYEYVRRTALPGAVSKNVLNANSNDWNLIRACLTAGLYPNVAFVDTQRKRLVTQFEKSVQFQQSSVLRSQVAATGTEMKTLTIDSLPTDWLIFNEKSRMGVTTLIKWNTVVTPLNILLFCGSFAVTSDSNGFEKDDHGAENNNNNSGSNDDGDDDADRESIKLQDIINIRIDKWITFRVTGTEYRLLNELKIRFIEIFDHFLTNIDRWQPQNYAGFVTSLRKLLAIENRQKFPMSAVKQPFDDSYLPKRYDTMMNVGHFQAQDRIRPAPVGRRRK